MAYRLFSQAVHLAASTILLSRSKNQPAGTLQARKRAVSEKLPVSVGTNVVSAQEPTTSRRRCMVDDPYQLEDRKQLDAGPGIFAKLENISHTSSQDPKIARDSCPRPCPRP